jgi:hypothetical protein
MSDATLLYVSDDPESFSDHGRLFHAPLPTDQSTIRLLYDHVNKAQTPMRVLVGIANLGAVAGSLNLLGGSAGPDGNWMGVGHSATLRYLQAVNASASSWHTILPAGLLSVCDFIVQPQQCVAGIYDIGVGASAALEVRVIACDPSHDSLAIFDSLPESPDDGKQRRGVFDITGAAQPDNLTYSGQALSFEIGADAAVRPRAPLDTYGGSSHKGEYGVLKRFDCELPVGDEIWLYQSARGGEATASYLIDGQALASRAIKPTAAYKVAHFAARTAPTKTSITTMPEINSSYPLRLTLDIDSDAVGPGEDESPVYEV